MTASVVFEERVEIPLELRSLADFRRWSQSETFPERGRIDFLAGRIEVDMSPEDLFTHGTLKTELIRVLAGRNRELEFGEIFADRTRVSCPLADLSVEPDVVLVSHRSLDDGRVRLVPKSRGEPGRYVELEGAPELVVEIVSDASVVKDHQRLPEAYFRAGVQEYWLIDARGIDLVFRIHTRGATAFQPVAPDVDGFQESGVTAARYLLDRTAASAGRWRYELRQLPENPDD